MLAGVGTMADASEKPEILRESRFVVREGFLYRAFRTASIWMNKLFFGSLILLAIWLAYGGLTGQSACVGGVPQVAPGPNATGTVVDQGTRATCNVLLTPTSIYLGAMAAITFVLSILLGVFGLMVGKQILVEATPASDEVGAARPPQNGPGKP